MDCECLNCTTSMELSLFLMKQQRKLGIDELYVFIFPCLIQFPEWTHHYNCDDVKIATLAIANSGYMCLDNLYFAQRHWVLDCRPNITLACTYKVMLIIPS